MLITGRIAKTRRTPGIHRKRREEANRERSQHPFLLLLRIPGRGSLIVSPRPAPPPPPPPPPDRPDRPLAPAAGVPVQLAAGRPPRSCPLASMAASAAEDLQNSA